MKQLTSESVRVCVFVCVHICAFLLEMLWPVTHLKGSEHCMRFFNCHGECMNEEEKLLEKWW